MAGNDSQLKMTTTILVIDDSEDDQRLYRRAFKDFDRSFSLIMAQSAAAGFACIAEAEPDLILLDYNLPDMDGLSLMKRLAEHLHSPIPIIMLTGEGSTQVAVEAMKNGVDDYIVKDAEGRYLRLLPGVAGRVMAAHAQREQTRLLRKESETLLLRNQTLMQNSMDGIHVMGMQGNIVEANAAFCRMLGYTPEEMVRLNVADWDAQWSAEELRQIFKDIIGKYTRFETVHRRKDGTLMNVEISSSGMEIEGQHFLFAVSHDITKRKQADETIRESENKFRLLFDYASDCILILGLDGRIEDINRTGHERLGYSKEEMLGQRIARFDTPDFASRVAGRFAEIQAKGYARFESAHVRKDGSVMPIEVSAKIVEFHGQQKLLSLIRDITERKQAEEKLLKNEANLHAMLDNSPYLTWLKDTEGRYIMINKMFADFLRIEDPQHVIGKTDLDLQPKELAEKYRADDAAVMAARQHKRVEESAFDGKRSSWVETFKTPIIDAHDQVLGTVGFARDITERKQAEEEIRLENESGRKRAKHMAQLFGQLLQSSFNEIYLFDACSLHFLETSEGAERNLGYSADELEQLTPLDLKPLYTRESFEKLIAPLRSGQQKALFFDTLHRRKDGTTYPVEVSLQLMEAEPPMFLSVIQDVTERKIAEGVLRLHSNILKNMAEGVFLIRASDGVIVFANPQFEQLFGYEPDELLGKHVSVVNAPGESSPEAVADAIMGELARAGMWSGEVCNIRKNKTTFWCRASVSAFEHAQFGKVWVAVQEDITERKHSEQQARELSAHLQSVREEEKASFAREIHDDLGGTLAALKMDAYWLESKLAAEKGMEALRECAKSMAGLLDAAVLSTRRIITDLRPTLLDDLGLVAALKWQCVEFHKRTGIECAVVCAEDTALENMLDGLQLINLFRISQETLTNVARHSGASRVEVDLYQDGEEVVLKICDNGRGLPELHTIPPTSYGLRGMRERIVLLGGNIEFDSTPGSGFSVTAILPLHGVNEK